MTVPNPSPPPFQPSPASRVERIHGALVRWMGGLYVVALVAGFGAAALNSELLWLLLFGMILLAVGMVAVPAACMFALGLRDPGRVPDRIRVNAAVAGLAGILWGWYVVTHLPLPGGKVVGMLLGVLAAIALVQLVRAPRPASWRFPAGALFALILAGLSVRLPPMFQGTKPKAYLAAARTAVTDVVSMELGVLADSGHFTATLDSFVLHPPGGAQPVVTLTVDGYTVRATHSASTAVCAAYAGSTPIAPARQPGVVACTPYTDPFIAIPAVLGLLALGLLVPLVWLLAGRRAIRQGAG